jgi:ABC-type nitrate/sulfonate/bicarbonate transport system substrate-binding protein
MNPVGNGAKRLAALLASKEAAGGVLNPPYTAQAKAAGLKSLGRLVDHLGPYQAGGLFIMRAYAKANSTAVEAFIAGYVEALRFARTLAHREFCIDLLTRHLKVERSVAEATLAEALDPAFGFAMDARLDRTGLDHVLATRAETEGEDPRLSDPARYIDESWYEQALASLKK